MTKSSKAAYINLCKTENIPVYSQAFWLDTVLGQDGWNVVILKNKEKQIIGALPYPTQKKFGMTVSQTGSLLTYIHIYIRYPDNPLKLERKLSIEKKIISSLLNSLPNFALSQWNFSPQLNNHLPFYWKGFRQTTRYTYIIDMRIPLENLWSNFKGSVRSDIKKVKSSFDICLLGPNIDEFLFFWGNQMQKKGIHLTRELDVFRQLYFEYSSQKIIQIFQCKNNDTHQVISFLVIVKDGNTIRNLLSVHNSQSKGKSGIHYLYWHIMKKYHSQMDAFDLEGSMLPNIEHLFRSLGAQPHPYFQIYKYKSKWIHSLAILMAKK